MPAELTGRAVQGVQGLTPYVPGKPIEELERELGISNIIKLASNENPSGPSPAAKSAAEAALSELGRYPDGNGFTLKHRLAEKHAIDADCIVLGNGSNDVLDMVARCFLGPGRNAVFSEYAFAVYPISTRASGARSHVARALPADHSRQPYGHDPEAMLARIDSDTGVVFVANPNNPTGTWLDADSLSAFVADVPAQTIVVLDEAYYEYMAPESRPDSRQLLDRHSNLVITRTFSKVHGLAALRIGYGLASREVADLLNRVRQPFNNNSIALAAALASLDDDEHIERSVKLNAEGLNFLGRELSSLGEVFGLDLLPSQANFLTIDFRRDAQEIFNALLHRGVIVRPLASYAMPNCLRVTTGSMEENQRFIDSLKSVLAGEGSDHG